MLRPAPYLWMCLAAITGVCLGADLDTYKGVFETERGKIDVIAAEDRAKAGEQYIKHLKSLIAYMAKAGDDFGVRPAREELNRFERTGTVPAASGVGTPDLIKKARTFYHDAMLKARTAQAERMATLTAKYVQRLNILRAAYEKQGRDEEEAAVAAEIGRVSGGGKSSGPDETGKVLKVDLPGALREGLLAAYVFDAGQPEVSDRSGRGNHAKVKFAGWRAAVSGRGALWFKGPMDMLRVDGVAVGREWAMVTTVHFPLDGTAAPRVLVSHGFRRHHLVIDESGELGTWPDKFSGSGYKVNELAGWHKLGVVSGSGKTVFYVNGERVGWAPAACVAPVNVIGNDKLGRRQCGARLADVMIWARAFSGEDMKILTTIKP